MILAPKAILEAVGEILAEERAKRVALEAEVAKLKREVEALKERSRLKVA